MLFSKGILASRDAPDLKALSQGSIAGEPFFVVMGEVDFVDGGIKKGRFMCRPD